MKLWRLYEFNMLVSNNINFGAKFYNYPHAYNHPDIAKGFEEATKKYPDYILLQDNISYFGNDSFYLLKGKNILGYDSIALTNMRKYLSNNDVVNRLVTIFNKLLENQNK